MRGDILVFLATSSTEKPAFSLALRNRSPTVSGAVFDRFIRSGSYWAFDENVPGLRSARRPHDSGFLQLIQQQRGPRVAQTQPPLQHRGGGLTGLQHDLFGFLKQFIAFPAD